MKHLCSANKEEIQNITFSFHQNKSLGPNSIPTRILKQLTNNISGQLADILNISFSTGILHTVLMVVKFVSVDKKGFELVVSKYQQISLSANIEELLEKLI